MSEPLFAARQRDALIEACLRHPVLDVRYYPGDDVIYATTNDGDEVVAVDVDIAVDADDAVDVVDVVRSVGGGVGNGGNAAAEVDLDSFSRTGTPIQVRRRRRS